MAKVEFTDTTLQQLIEERDQCLARARRIDDALDLLRGVGKRGTQVARLMDKVREQATGEPRERPISAREFMKQHADINAKHPSDEARRVMELATAQGLRFKYPAMASAFFAVRTEARTGMTTHQRMLARKGKSVGRPKQAKVAKPALGLSKYQQKRARAASGDTVSSRLRAVLQRTGDKVVTREFLQTEARIAEIVPDARYTAAGTAKALEAMARNKEVKKTKDGWVAHKLQPQTVANDNGAQA